MWTIDGEEMWNGADNEPAPEKKEKEYELKENDIASFISKSINKKDRYKNIKKFWLLARINSYVTHTEIKLADEKQASILLSGEDYYILEHYFKSIIYENGKVYFDAYPKKREIVLVELKIYKEGDFCDEWYIDTKFKSAFCKNNDGKTYNIEFSSFNELEKCLINNIINRGVFFGFEKQEYNEIFTKSLEWVNDNIIIK